MALKIEAKCKGKVTCTFKNDRNWANMHRLE